MLTRKWIIDWLIRSIVVLIWTSVAGLGISQAAWAEFKVGVAVPEFSLKVVDDSSFSFKQDRHEVIITQDGKTLKPKVVMIHLFQPDCLQCQAQMEALQSLYQKFKDQGVSVL